jgi:heme/copper-type cytochrome/quinol oxidase subunit 1
MRTKWRLVTSWLLVSVGLTALLAGTLVGFEALQKPVLDIQLHNTYFVLTRPVFIGLLFVPTLLVVGLVTALLRRHSIMIHLLLAALSAVLSGVAGNAAYALGTMGWTVYPPLNADSVLLAPPATPYQSLLVGAYALQVLAALFFGYNCYRAGKLSATHQRGA